jgi:hypothetical protein
MFRKSRLLLFAGFCFMAFAGVSCGKSDGESVQEKDKPKQTDKTAKSDGSLQQIAKDALDEASLDDEAAAGRRIVETAGYVVKEYRSFPAQEITKRGRVLVYTDKKGKHSGGVIFLKRTGFEAAPAWHWYFEDMVPDSVINVEINQDGLWDLRIVSTRGKDERFVQGESFSLFARERTDWIAMNGSSSAPVSEDAAMWKCFDGDTTTAWKSSLSGGAFIEFNVPFGVTGGNLSLYTMTSEQPRGCAVYADGKRMEDIELQPVAGRQVIALGQGVRGAKKIRLEFTSAHANAATVAVAELGLD